MIKSDDVFVIELLQRLCLSVYFLNQISRSHYMHQQLLLTILRDTHELDCHFLLLLLVFAKHYLTEASDSKLFDYSVVVQYSTEIEVLS
jgi:hypothetical protein